jgi:hypothetical protein
MHAGYLAVLLQVAGAAFALPSAENPADVEIRADDRGSYTVAGLGTRKQAVLTAGGNTLDLAIAMLETENMGTDYAYGMFPVKM